VKEQRGGRSELPPLAHYARSFLGSALTSFRDVELSSNCLAKHELASVSCATTFGQQLLLLTNFQKLPRLVLPGHLRLLG
jgi:hypothetical protein